DPQQQCPGGWIEVGAADAQAFPALAQLAPEAQATVYVSYSPSGPAPGQGPFLLSPGLRARIDPVAGEQSPGDNAASWGLVRVTAPAPGNGAAAIPSLRFDARSPGQYFLGVLDSLPPGAAVVANGQIPILPVYTLSANDPLPLSVAFAL